MDDGDLNTPGTSPPRSGDLRLYNCRTLLRILRAHSPCSHADLARYSGLSAPTVTAAVGSLAGLGLVENLGEGPTEGGRPQELLRLCAGRGLVAGADIGGTHLRMMLADLGGEPVGRFRATPPPAQKDPASICALLHEGLRSMCREAGVAVEKVLGMGVGAPGITDTDAGVVLSAPNLDGWTDVPLGALFEEQAGVPAVVENDVNLAALGEHWRGSAAGVEDFLFLAIGTGIGAGIFVRGRIYHGARWSAGEIGYLGVPGQPQESPDPARTGQLECAVGGAGVERLWREELLRSGRAGEAQLAGLRASEIFDRAGDGDADAGRVLLHAAGILADAIRTAALVLDPALVVLGGGVGAHPGLAREIGRQLAQGPFPFPALRTSLLGTEAQLFGAIALSLSAVEERLVC